MDLSTLLATGYIAPLCLEQVDILFADKDLLLVNKPTGLLSVPGRHPANNDCLIARLQANHPGARIVHRLDMATSGVMVVALNANSHRLLSQLFADRQIEKHYEAVVWGLVAENQQRISLPLMTDWENRPKQKVDMAQGKAAQTDVVVLKRNAELQQTRVQLLPLTGRSHQLRVHLMAIGHPILGCEFYAHEQARQAASRLLLHATRLAFTHPISGEPIEAISPSPF